MTIVAAALIGFALGWWWRGRPREQTPDLGGLRMRIGAHAPRGTLKWE